jgi:glycosyltransferase involved in cell wall biosynthesis
MKIVHVSHHYYPVIGGLERAVQSLAIELARLGHEVHVVTSKYGAEDRPREEVINSVYVHRVKALRLYYPDLTYPLEYPKNILKDADVIICWSQNSYFTYRICRYAKDIGKKLAVYFLGIDYLRYHYNPFIRVFGYIYQKFITHKMVNIADIAFVTNEYEMKLLKEKYPINAIILPHGIDEKYLKMPNMAENFKEKYNIKDRIIAYIGRIHPTKGIELLIRAFAKVAMKMPDTILIIAGSGNERYLEKCANLSKKLGIKEKIKFIGYISEEDKIALIDASNVIVLPTKHAGESYPLLVNEVLARKKRLVITRGSIASKWVEEGGIARVVDADSQELAQAIIDELNFENYIIIDSNRTMKVLTWRDVAYKLLNFLQQVWLWKI